MEKTRIDTVFIRGLTRTGTLTRTVCNASVGVSPCLSQCESVLAKSRYIGTVVRLLFVRGLEYLDML
jgi:hypothetical protein